MKASLAARALAAALTLASACALAAPARPSLMLTADAVARIRSAPAQYPLFERALHEAETRVDASIAEGVVVPPPKDAGGGPSHERHKENGRIIADAGTLWQLTGEARYAEHAQRLLLAYADLYEGLPLHPQAKGKEPGRLFWQNLNEAVWLVYAIQGYDAIADRLDAASRVRIEQHLLRPMADFLSTGSAYTFRSIHNHATWAAAAVGMTGYALHDEALVKRALLGLDGDGRSGFLAQLDQLFSPDGYYTEGPYYQRYALMPFVLFAQAIEHNEPARHIFEHRDGVLLKAIDVSIQESYAGKFFPINDAIKDKGLDTIELVYGVAAAYGHGGDAGLLSIAERQGATVLTGDGLAVAQAVAAGKAQPYRFRSLLLGDGADGREGALAILRMGDGELAQTVVFKATGQGMGHGHFDRLDTLLYDDGHEVLRDYGAARFLNVPSKDGGRYLDENDSWAKQTIAHNTLVVNEASQYGGQWKRGQQHAPALIYYHAGDDANVVSAKADAAAYPGTEFARTLAQFTLDAQSPPLLLDVLAARSAKPARYDLPYYFNGQIVDVGFPYKAFVDALAPFGTHDGYQHLWLEALGDAPAGRDAPLSWLLERRFYTLHSLAAEPTQMAFVRVGAHDPDFNLRSEQGLVMRAAPATARVFVSVLEPHGDADGAAEVTVGAQSRIAALRHVRDAGMDLVSVELRDGRQLHIALSNDADPKAAHRLSADGRDWQWSGFYHLFREP